MVHYDSMDHAEIAEHAVRWGLFKTIRDAMTLEHKDIAYALAYLSAVEFKPNPRRIIKGRKRGRRIRRWNPRMNAEARQWVTEWRERHDRTTREAAQRRAATSPRDLSTGVPFYSPGK